MTPLMFRINRWVVLATCMLMPAGSVATAAMQDTPELAARRIEAVKALRLENEENMDGRVLLSALGRNGLYISPTGSEAGRIEVVFTDEQGSPMPLNGWLSYETNDGKPQGCLRISLSSGITPVSEGRASIILRGKERRVVLYSEGLPGYAFAKKDRFGRKDTFAALSLPEGETSVRATIPLEPAGAMRWRIVDEAGHPETQQVKYWLYTPTYSTWSEMGPTDRRLLIRPARFNESYRLVVQKGARFADSSPPCLTPDEPVADLVIAFNPGKTVAGRLIDAGGRPVAGASLRLAYQIMEPQPTMLEAVAEVVTRDDGGFLFESINLDMPNRYWLVFASPDGAGVHRTLPMHRIAIDARTPLPVEMWLPPVHVARGRLLDVGTGKPIVGVRVWALMHEQFSKTGRPNWLPVFEVPATGPTDENGGFQFTNLPAGVYDFKLSAGRLALNGSEVSAEGGARVAGETDIDLLRVPHPVGNEPAVFWVRP